MLSLRERAAGTYYASAYFLAKYAAETVFQLPMPIIFSALVYWISGLQVGRGPLLLLHGWLPLLLENQPLCRTGKGVL
jgi:hypothetical protein